MQTTPQKESKQNRANPKTPFRSFFPAQESPTKEGKMIIVKSFSAQRNKSLTIQSFFRKCSQSTTSRFKVRIRTESRGTKEEIPKRDRSVPTESKSLFNCAEELERYRRLQKEDIFSKLSDVQRKLSRQARHAKNRENRRYIVQSKANRHKYYNNSINSTDIASLITVKHITNTPKTPDREDRYRKYRVDAALHQPKLIRLLHRGFLKQSEGKPTAWSQQMQLKPYKRLLQHQQFSAWKTQQDYDF